MSKILVLCTGNSCRSQMADGWLKNLFNSFEVYSAGTSPEPVNPYAVKVMMEVGIDISNFKSNHVNEYKDYNFDLVFTVCNNAKEICPIFSRTKKMVHKNFDDPAIATGDDEEVLNIYREVRDEIKYFFLNFFDEK